MITIYQLLIDVDTPLTALYAVCVSLWVTFFIEKWKRKSSEISSKWGIYDLQEKGMRQMRDEFNGDECFS